MNQYYYNQTDRRKPSRRPLGLVLLDTMMLLVSIISLAALLLTLVTSHYDPAISWVFPIVGLFSPAIYILALLLALYWIIRWRWLYAIFLIIPLVIGAPQISHYAKIETKREFRPAPRRGVVKLMSYNVRSFINDAGQSSTLDMVDFLEQQRPDIICFQEFAADRWNEHSAPDFMKSFNLVKINELAIYSRYKIIESSSNLINADYDSGTGLWADLLVGEDTMRLYNIHLHSTTINNRDNEYISNMEFLVDTMSRNTLKGMLSRFKNTSIGRASQADTIAYSIAQTPHRVVVCGDFNDTPNSYAFRKISHGLQDAFQEAGVGYPHTFRGFMNILRIDYILVEEPTEVISYQIIDSVLLSDHLPVITTLKL